MSLAKNSLLYILFKGSGKTGDGGRVSAVHDRKSGGNAFE